jgi:pimeloyl-ACP methyl ester carboxylesterase
MTAREGTMRLPDGRVLAYEECGDPDGVPVVLAHGFPGSRLEARVVDMAAGRAGVRLVCPDRPGFGRSDPQPGRRLADWPGDVAALADELRLERFAVVGFSAGGPYAVACAVALAGRVTALGLVSSPGPLDRPGSTDGMTPLNRALFGGGRRAPIIARLIVSILARSARVEPARLAKRLATGMSDADGRTLADPAIGEAYAVAVREAFRHGSEGAVREASLLVHPWPYSADQITVPTAAWHGTADRNVPVSMARRLAESIPGCRLELIDDAGHLLFFERAEATLTTLRAAATARPAV